MLHLIRTPFLLGLLDPEDRHVRVNYVYQYSGPNWVYYSIIENLR